MHRTALVAGATGLVGDLLLRRLVLHPEYGAARALCRRQPDDDPRIEWVPTDFSNLDELGDRLAVDDVYCCLGTTREKAGGLGAFQAVDYGMVVDLARATRKAGANRFIVISALGASRFSPFFYPRVKAHMERDVSRLGFDAVHILRPSLLKGLRPEFRFWEDFLTNTIAPWASELMIGPLEVLKPIDGDSVAKAMIDLAVHGKSGVHVHHLPLKKSAFEELEEVGE
jgi:uncharacterized protein YbjT (DUF2867 family)